MNEETKEITEALMCALASPTSKVGKRLNSEPNLAEVFSVGRFRLRKSIDVLVKKGILARRKGSGTFVTRIPKKEELAENCSFFVERQILPKDLFAECSEIARITPAEAKTKISIGFWSDVQVGWRTTQIFLPCLVKYISKTGNCLHLHSTVEEANKPYPIDKLAEQMRNNPSDAYLFESRWADLLIEAIGSVNCPVLFTGKYSDTKNFAYVTIDTFAAIQQAISIFKNQGFERIGLIGLGDIDGHSWQAEVKSYRAAMFTEDLTYTAFQSSDASESSSIAALRGLLSRSDPPEAIYVADDYVMAGVAKGLAMEGLVPGKDIAIITLTNKNVNLLADYKYEFSQMEVDMDKRAMLSVDLLVNAVQRKEKLTGAYTVNPCWIPGATHFIK